MKDADCCGNCEHYTPIDYYLDCGHENSFGKCSKCHVSEDTPMGGNYVYDTEICENDFKKREIIIFIG